MTSWVREITLNWIERVALNIIKAGPIPRHIAFIMDGNRRYATQAHLQLAEGHYKGFDKLSELLQWCQQLGVHEITVYAFSIENFKRNTSELETLMQLARDKFTRLLEEQDKLNERGICIRVIGNLALLPVDIQQKMVQAMLLTRHNTNAILNVAMSYTSRDEITDAVRTVVQGVADGELQQPAVTKDVLFRCMYSRHATEPDLLIRTSGELRLSDFLLWQVSATVILFTKRYWPGFTFWHFLYSIFYYQRHYRDTAAARHHLNQITDATHVDTPNKIKSFLEDTERKRLKQMQDFVGLVN